MTEPLDLEEGKKLLEEQGDAATIFGKAELLDWLNANASTLLDAAARLRVLEQRHTEDPALCPFCDWSEDEAHAALSPAAPEEDG